RLVVLLCHPGVDFGALVAGNAEGVPLAGAEVLGEENNLPAVIRVVPELPHDRLHDGVGLAANGHGAAYVLGLEQGDGIEHVLPTGFPPAHDVVAGRVRVHDEFLVAVAIRLFAVGSEEVSEAGTHVAGQMLDDDRDAVCLGIEGDKELVFAQLVHGAFGQALGPTKIPECLVEKCRCRIHSFYPPALRSFTNARLPTAGYCFPKPPPPGESIRIRSPAFNRTLNLPGSSWTEPSLRCTSARPTAPSRPPFKP